MIQSYLWRSLNRNKTRSLLVMIGIIISIMLVSGVNITANRMAFHLIRNKMDNVKVDFAVKSTNANITANLDKLELLTKNLDEYVTSYATGYVPFSELMIQLTDTTINWGQMFNRSSSYRACRMNNTHFIGLSDNIFENEEIARRYQDVINFSTPLDLSLPGLYMDSKYALKHNYSIGQQIALHLAYSDYDYDPLSDTSEILNISVSIYDIPVLGFFDLLDYTKIASLHPFRGSPTSRNSVFLIGNLTYFQEKIHNTFLNQLEILYQDTNQDNAWYYQRFLQTSGEYSIAYGVIIDHAALINLDPNAQQSRLNFIETRIYHIGGNDFNSVAPYLLIELQEIREEILIYEILFLVISIPAVILGWYLCKINWIFNYQRRQREITLLKIKGGQSKELKILLYLEAGIIGALGGIIGIFGGILSSSIMLNLIFPQVVDVDASMNILEDVMIGHNMILSTGIVGLIGGVVLSLLAVKNPLNEFLKKQPSEGLAKYNETTQNSIPYQMRDKLFLIIGILPLIILPVSRLGLDQGGFEFNSTVAPFLELFTAFFPFASFLLIYALVKLFCRNIGVFQKLVQKISSIFSKSVAKYTSKSILNNQTRSFRLVFIVAISLSFLVMTSILEHSELAYQEELALIETGGGLRIRYSEPTMKEHGINSTLDAISMAKSELGYESFIHASTLTEITFPGGSPENGYPPDYVFDIHYYGMIAIPSVNFSQHMDFRDRWFDGPDGKNIVEKLATGNYILIPQAMVDRGFSIGSFIMLEYQLLNSSMGKIPLEIIGGYNAFPIASSQWSTVNMLIVDESWVVNASIKEVNFVFYPAEDQTIEDLNGVQYTEFFWDLDALEAFVSEIDPMEGDMESIAKSSIYFLNLESYYLVSIVFFGIMIIMYISVKEKSHDMGLLRARGVPKRALYYIQLVEGLTLILIGSIFSLIGILGAVALLFQLNNLDMFQVINFEYASVILERTLKIPWGKLGLQLIGSMILFTLSIFVAVKIEIRKSNVSKIGRLLRIAS